MVLQDILRAKGTEVQTVELHTTLDDVVKELVRRNIGSLVVIRPDGRPGPQRPVGIITERDVLRTRRAQIAVFGTQCIRRDVARVENGRSERTDRRRNAEDD